MSRLDDAKAKAGEIYAREGSTAAYRNALDEIDDALDDQFDREAKTGGD